MVGLNLKKGMSLDLKKKEDNLNVLGVALGWNTEKDLDAFAFLIDDEGKIVETIAYFHKNAKGIFLDKDNLTGSDDYNDSKHPEDDETITVNFNNLANNIQKIVFGANIYNAQPSKEVVRGIFKKQTVILEGDNFGQINGTFIRCYNKETDEEICRYNLTEEGQKFNAFQFASMTKTNEGWKFTADGIGMNGAIAELKDKVKY